MILLTHQNLIQLGGLTRFFIRSITLSCAPPLPLLRSAVLSSPATGNSLSVPGIAFLPPPLRQLGQVLLAVRLPKQRLLAAPPLATVVSLAAKILRRAHIGRLAKLLKFNGYDLS